MNIATQSMNHMTRMLRAIDQKYKEFATEPYAQKKLTERERWEEYKNLTPDKLIDIARERGFQKTNDWLNRMEQLEAKYGR